MESNERYYRRRALQEMAAARRAVTAAALIRRRTLAETYLRRLHELTGIDEMPFAALTSERQGEFA